MKNRKKPLIKEKRSLAKAKLSKAFTLISANRFDIIKRAFGIAFTLVLACSLVLPFISNNKALALSSPPVIPEPHNAYTGFYHNMIIEIEGDFSNNMNPTTYYDGIGNGNLQGYGSYNGNSTNNLLTTIDQTRTAGVNITNDYYDGTAQSNNIYLRQAYSPNDNTLYLSAYRVHSLRFYLTQPTILYMGEDLSAFNDLLIWYYNPTGYSIQNPNTANINNAPVPFNMRTSDQITCMEVYYHMSYTDSNNNVQNIDITQYTNVTSIADTDNIHMPQEIIDSLTFLPQANNCLLFNEFSISIRFYQRTYLSALQNYTYNNNPTTNPNEYAFNYYLTQEQTNPGYITNIYNSPLYASSVYIKLPFYEDNLETTLNITKRANEIYLDKMFSEYVTINDFWLELINFEIFPNFKFSYLLTMSLGIVVIIIFVRLFR